jgi:hypothetical protein
MSRAEYSVEQIERLARSEYKPCFLSLADNLLGWWQLMVQKSRLDMN